MAKKMISFILKEIIVIFALILCTILFFNISTLISMKKIENGTSVETGYASAIVISGSMTPALSKYDLIIVKAKSEYHVGNIITYVSHKGTLITHRIINVTENGIIAQGDANNTPDQNVMQDRILGEVIWVIPFVGLIIKLLSMPIGIISIILIPTCILLIIHLIKKMKIDREVVT